MYHLTCGIIEYHTEYDQDMYKAMHNLFKQF